MFVYNLSKRAKPVSNFFDTPLATLTDRAIRAQFLCGIAIIHNKYKRKDTQEYVKASFCHTAAFQRVK